MRDTRTAPGHSASSSSGLQQRLLEPVVLVERDPEPRDLERQLGHAGVVNVDLVGELLAAVDHLAQDGVLSREHGARAAGRQRGGHGSLQVDAAQIVDENRDASCGAAPGIPGMLAGSWW